MNTEKQSKHELWEQIKSRSPDLAMFLVRTKQLFGHYELKKVTFR